MSRSVVSGRFTTSQNGRSGDPAGLPGTHRQSHLHTLSQSGARESQTAHCKGPVGPQCQSLMSSLTWTARLRSLGAVGLRRCLGRLRHFLPFLVCSEFLFKSCMNSGFLILHFTLCILCPGESARGFSPLNRAVWPCPVTVCSARAILTPHSRPGCLSHGNIFILR